MLRKDTEKLWNHLKLNKLLSGFILVGGTALAMHLKHRTSEDLDFMFPAKRLPREQIELLKKECFSAGFKFKENDSPAGILEFEDTGMDYHNYQQDFIVADSIKLTLVAPDSEVTSLLNPANDCGPRIANIEEIFRLKCIACANRSKSRDWLDIYVMLKNELFQPIDIYESFKIAGIPSKFDIAMMRMTSGKVQVNDEGYEALMPNPPKLDDIHKFFLETFTFLREEVANIKRKESQIN